LLNYPLKGSSAIWEVNLLDAPLCGLFVANWGNRYIFRIACLRDPLTFTFHVNQSLVLDLPPPIRNEVAILEEVGALVDERDVATRPRRESSRVLLLPQPI
jgi:hypothetical protein